MGVILQNEKAVFIELKRDEKISCIVAKWNGLLNMQDVEHGGLAIIEELENSGYRKLLNDNRQVIGDWRSSSEWLKNVWLPMAIKYNLQKLAHVLSPYYYGKLSAEALMSIVNGRFQMMLFKSEEEARLWLME